MRSGQRWPEDEMLKCEVIFGRLLSIPEGTLNFLIGGGSSFETWVEFLVCYPNRRTTNDNLMSLLQKSLFVIPEVRYRVSGILKK